ncbi:hypothetical protein NQZ68_028148 [Dissostichus eleginoides]|nr:hypothetical protein NQZ68_028148 [Dissostichus eleginoides]
MGSILVGQTSELIPNLRPLCHARLLLTGKSQALAVFIDSGSDLSIIDEELALQLGIQQGRLPQPVGVLPVIRFASSRPPHLNYLWI